MATRSISRSIPRLLTRSFASSAPLSRTPAPSSLLSRSRPLAAAALSYVVRVGFVSAKGLSSQATVSSMNAIYSQNRPPKETILLDGCDFEHWLVVVDPPQGDPTRDEIIDSYIKTLAQIVGTEEEARMKIYSVSHRCYFAFGALVSEDLSHKLKDLPNVRWVLPDSYLDVRNKDYGGEPFIDGRAVPYDPKYHEEWIRNNARANDRNKRPRNSDKSRHFERRPENMYGVSPPQRPPMGGPPPSQNYGGPPPSPNNMGGQRPPPNYGGAPPQNNMGGQRPPPNYGGPPPPKYVGAPTPPNYGGPPPPLNYGGAPPANYGGAPPQTNMGGAPPPNYGGAPPQNNMGGGPPNAGWSGNNNYQQQTQYQNNYPPNRGGSGNPY
ncbi:hypothetical protein Bca52824_020952 [Brassica carinata]|uniref:MORF/ORRM1/DAG-like MORF domain-containing protein n=1 Tax=Brassica carinata TaxID=52824 RepID=A0A8X8B034_BRACI|nr:hypothetical protein Bca52824_020952 [Brassica carinata]